MKILFKNIAILYENGDVETDMCLSTDDRNIDYIGKMAPEHIKFDRVIDGTGKLLCPGFYKCHTHSPMTLFRGYAEDLPLSRWLHEKIFPAEDRLYPEAVHDATMLSAAEMIKNGTVSCSDMYFFCDQIIDAIDISGMKANISRSLVAFDPNITPETDTRFQEAKDLFYNYHNSAEGRIKIDMSVHAEYSTVAAMSRYLSDFALENGLSIQVHISESMAEHRECIERNGVTPTEFFMQNGLFRVPVIAAHCVHLSDRDMEIFSQCGATAVHNPSSNLKLGSGVMSLDKLLDAGVNVALGTDGAASNNALDILKEAYLAAILQKGISGDTAKLSSKRFIPLLTENGAKAQGRVNCGKIKVGYAADLIMMDFDAINVIPIYDYCDSFLYSANSSNVVMTMVDGKILYENGDYKTIDIEKIKYQFKNIISTYFR